TGLSGLTRLLLLTLQVSVFFTVFGFGLKTTLDDLLSLVRRPALLVRSVVAGFVIMPVFAVLLGRLFDFARIVEISLVALAISPVPPLLPQRQTQAGGATHFVLALMAVLSVAAIVIVPLALEILELASGRPLAITPVAVARIVTISTLLPLAAGMLVHAIRPPLAASIERPVTLVGSTLLPVAALALIVTAAPAIWALVGDGTVFAIVLFLVTGLAVGQALGGPEPDHSLGLALSTAYRHPAMAVSIAAS